MKFAYELLSDAQFEELIVLLCKCLLGTGVSGFAPGADGGRDAKFVGIAELYPSKSGPWNGIIIVQAKHTAANYKTCSDADFFSKGSLETIVGKEIPKIKKLVSQRKLDHYMLFTNRRLTAGAEEEIRSYISEECGIQYGSIYIGGVHQIETWLKEFPNVSEQAEIDPIDSPLSVSPDDLAEVVEALARNKDVIKSAVDDPPTPRIPYNKKNILNNMTPEYAKALLRKYLKETKQVQTFLSAPENEDLLNLYESAVDDFDLKIIARRKDYQTFDDMMNYLKELLINRDPVLRKHKRLTSIMLFYMYWNCDIGETGDATAI